MFRRLARRLAKTRDTRHKRDMQKYNFFLTHGSVHRNSMPCFLEIDFCILQPISILTYQVRLKIIDTNSYKRFV